MMNLSNDQYHALESQATAILKSVSEGQSTRDIMARIYVENLDDKTFKQGQLMADTILKNVKEFDASYQEAKENPDRFIDKFQDKIDQGKSSQERCTYWLRFSAALSSAAAAMSGEGADREQILQNIEDLQVAEDEATPEREDELRAQAKETIRNSGVMLGALAQQAEALEAMDTADEAAALLIDLGNKEIEYRGIVAMLAYTKIKNGEFDNMPVDITAAQVTAIVCAQIEQIRIMEAVGNGHLAVDIASMLLSILGVVLLTMFTISFLTIGIFVALNVFKLIFAIPLCLMISAGMLRLFKKAADAWITDSEKIMKGVAVAVRYVVSGLKAVAVFVKDKVLPDLILKAKGIMTAVRQVFAGVVKQENETVTANG